MITVGPASDILFVNFSETIILNVNSTRRKQSKTLFLFPKLTSPSISRRTKSKYLNNYRLKLEGPSSGKIYAIAFKP